MAINSVFCGLHGNHTSSVIPLKPQIVIMIGKAIFNLELVNSLPALTHTLTNLIAITSPVNTTTITTDAASFQKLSFRNKLLFHMQVTVPLLLVNSADDPLVHQSLLTIPRTLAGLCS